VQGVGGGPACHTPPSLAATIGRSSSCSMSSIFIAENAVHANAGNGYGVMLGLVSSPCDPGWRSRIVAVAPSGRM
jgi:hypothetical protein